MNASEEQAWLQRLVVDDDDARMFRVHFDAFTDPRILALERRRVFERCWIYAGHTSEIPQPQDFVARRVGGRLLILSRGRDDVVRAMLNTCTHSGATVCRAERGTTSKFVCPYHGWTFDPTGKLIGIPGRNEFADSLASTDLDLKTARIEAYRDFLFVTFDPDAPPLTEYLAGATQYLDLICDQLSLGHGIELACGQSYEVQANWKLPGPNSLDGYHLGFLHRRFFAAFRAEAEAGPGTRMFHLGNGHCVGMGEPGRRWSATHLARIADWYGVERADAIRNASSIGLLIFPNLILIDNTGLTLRTFQPITEGRTVVNSWMLAPRGIHEVDLHERERRFVLFNGPGGLATSDDVEVLESCQRSFENREVEWCTYVRGMHRTEHYMDDELGIRTYYRRWYRAIVGSDSVTTGVR